MRTIAVVGMSHKPERPSNFVALYMQDQGYAIIPVNPGQKEIAEAAIKINAKALWLQDGVINKDAAKLVKEAGLLIVMNDCMLRRHRMMQ